MDQDDPKIQRLLAQDRGDADLTAYDSDAGSVYDFEDDADRFAFEMDEESDSDEDDSDYDSDRMFCNDPVSINLLLTITPSE
jgi:hypothetical protein